MHIIIVGAGNVGTPLVEMAMESRNEVVVIEQDEARANELADEYDCLVLHADATSERTLEEAGASQADALIATTEDDATNHFVCLIAMDLGIPTVVSVLHRPENRGMFEKMNVDAVRSPDLLAAESLFRTARQPPVLDYMPVDGGGEVFEIEVHEEASVAGKTIEDIESAGLLPDDVRIVVVSPEDEEARFPDPETEIETGSLVTVYSARGAESAVTDIFGFYGDREQ